MSAPGRIPRVPADSARGGIAPASPVVPFRPRRTPLRAAVRESIFVALAVLPALLVAVAAHSRVAGADLPWDRWFDADIPRVVAALTHPLESESRTNVHPAFTVLFSPPVLLADALTGGAAAPLMIAVLMALAGAGLVLSFYALQRSLGSGPGESATFCLLATQAAGFVFWAGVPETFLVGAPTLVLSLWLAARADRDRPPGAPASAAVSALTLAITITNWAAGLLATFLVHPRRRALAISAMALGAVGGLNVVQNWLFPPSGLIGNIVLQHELRYVPGEGGPWPVLRAAVVHTFAAPALYLEPIGETDKIAVRMQDSALGSAGTWGAAAATGWVALLALGGWGFVRLRQYPRFRIACAGLLAMQLGLHLFYGRETFLYAPHFLAVLLPLAALAVRTPARRVALALALLVAACGALDNWRQLDAAVALSHVPETGGTPGGTPVPGPPF
ncbi:MAG: hypothetical protein KBD01_08505 [Acidobacteria bacterium]|nr:hypothetical protein [Acidobacteriota bacterium]